MVSVLRGLSGAHLSNEELDDCVEEMSSAMKEFGASVQVLQLFFSLHYIFRRVRGRLLFQMWIVDRYVCGMVSIVIN